jgi:transposase
MPVAFDHSYHQITDDEWAVTPQSVRRVLENLLDELVRLREQVGATSRNSSKPPSSDPPHAPKRQRKVTGWDPGGQLGHPGVTRSLVPQQQVSEIKAPIRPRTCGHCGQSFAEMNTDPTPHRHQVWEIPAVCATVTEYRFETLTCPHCGGRTAPAWPAGISRGMLGPHAQALIAACTGHYHLSKRTTAELLNDCFGLAVSEASICATEQTISAALHAPYHALRQAIQEDARAWMDETGWAQQRDPDLADVLSCAETSLRKAWLWILVGLRGTVFGIRRSRGSKVAKDLLGEFSGVVHTDRWSAYSWLDPGHRQLCWAHLLRDFTAISERVGEAGALGRQLVEQTSLLFGWWRQYQAGTLTFAAFQQAMAPVQEAVGALLSTGAALAHAPSTARTCRRMLKLEVSLWTFVRSEGVEPTNNRAERGIRPGVMYRRRCFGTQTSAGSRYVERVMTAVATCRQHGRNVLAYLTEVATAALHCQPPPSLLTQAGHYLFRPP